ncbi:acyl-CoA thioesterase [Meiothermus granaticius]|uniref:acyl-CoA thioesterase n=1 Tax=Meiothermus granaticius TaxID=863370 RepID=UPI001F0C819A|nr:thioesterase family protein [Meiothermus granaticius]
MSEFPIHTPVEVRFRDLDPLGHVNNAVYLTYAELGRMHYIRAMGADEAGGNFILARAEVDFLRPVHLGESLEVRTRVPRVGNSSFHTLSEIWAEGHLAARVSAVVVWLEEGRPARIPEHIRAAVRRLETLPVEGV